MTELAGRRVSDGYAVAINNRC